jgi:hypothetical protein
MGDGVQCVVGVGGTAVSKYGCEMKVFSNLKLCFSAYMIHMLFKKSHFWLLSLLRRNVLLSLLNNEQRLGTVC